MGCTRRVCKRGGTARGSSGVPCGFRDPWCLFGVDFAPWFYAGQAYRIVFSGWSVYIGRPPTSFGRVGAPTARDPFRSEPRGSEVIRRLGYPTHILYLSPIWTFSSCSKSHNIGFSHILRTDGALNLIPGSPSFTDALLSRKLFPLLSSETQVFHFFLSLQDSRDTHRRQGQGRCKAPFQPRSFLRWVPSMILYPLGPAHTFRRSCHS
jgi:hypothetical protein